MLSRQFGGMPGVTDISRDGSALVSVTRFTIHVEGQAPGASAPLDLGWFDNSIAKAITPDGQWVLFDEQGRGTAGTPQIFIRKMDGSPAKRIGEGIARAISPDARWCVGWVGGAWRFD